MLRRRRERYRLQRERETPEEREVRLARRRELYRHRRATVSTEQHEAILQHRRAAYSTNAQVDELCSWLSSRCRRKIRPRDIVSGGHIILGNFVQPDKFS